MRRALSILIIADFAAQFPGAFIQSLEVLGKRVVENGGKIAFLLTAERTYHDLLRPYGPVYVCQDHDVRSRWSWLLFRDAWRICDEYNVNVVHTQFGLATELCGCILQFLGKAVHLWHWRSFPDSLLRQRQGRLKKIPARVFYRMVDCVGVRQHIAISPGLRDVLVGTGYIPRDKIQVIPNAIAVECYNHRREPDLDAIQRRIGANLDGRPIVGTIAHFGPEKDHQTLVEAISKVRKVLPDVALILVGEGLAGQGTVCVDQVRRQVELLDLQNTVYFAGRWERVEEIIPCFDVGVLSSHSEGFGNVIVEYMAMGKPVVATRVGGIPDVVIDGEIGYLVDPQDAEEMADKLLCLLRDVELRKQMGAAGRIHAEANFSLEAWTERMYGVYVEALRGEVQ